MAEKIILTTDCSSFTSCSVAEWFCQEKQPLATETPVGMAAAGSGEEGFDGQDLSLMYTE